MTREEAKEIMLKLLSEITKDFDVLEDEEKEAFNKAIEALEQEPCEVSEYDKDHIWYKGHQYISLRRFGEIKAEKEPKTGHWIMSNDGLYRPICDNCGAHPWKGYIPTVEEATERFKYCPNCGAKMVESCEKCLYAEETDGSHCYECVKGKSKFESQESEE